VILPVALIVPPVAKLPLVMLPVTLTLVPVITPPTTLAAVVVPETLVLVPVITPPTTLAPVIEPVAEINPVVVTLPLADIIPLLEILLARILPETSSATVGFDFLIPTRELVIST
jgi:hypothetical protein